MAIEVRGLRKSYGDVEAVRGVDLEVDRGQVFALLGPNGAGKSTTVEILEGHRERTAGSVSVLGMDPATGGREFRERIGIVLQETSVEKELTVAEAIDFYGRIYSRHRPAGELIEIVGLEEKADARVKTLSGGQKRRLELALGIVGDPELVFLDEPTTGFDPSARRQAWKIVDNLASLGKTILLTTHYMDEAQHLADTVAVIARGSIVAEGAPATLGGRAEAATTIRFSVPGDHDPSSIVAGVVRSEGEYVLTTHDSTRDLHRLTTWAMNGGFSLDNLAVSQPSLEDVYLSLVKEEG